MFAPTSVSAPLYIAAVNYARFVELWEEADPELQPRVTATRERLNEIVRARV